MLNLVTYRGKGVSLRACRSETDCVGRISSVNDKIGVVDGSVSLLSGSGIDLVNIEAQLGIGKSVFGSRNHDSTFLGCRRGEGEFVVLIPEGGAHCVFNNLDRYLH